MIRYETIAHIEEEEEGYRKLIAWRNILQGETIVMLPSKTLERADKYSVEVSPGVHIDCSNSLAGAINHSCTPNSAVRNFKVVAWACIKAREEITINYLRTEYEMAEPFKCNCCGTLIRGNKYAKEGSNSISS